MADIYHMELEGQDPAAEFRLAADQLRLVHVSDRARRLPGQGGIEFARYFNALKAQGYTGYLGFECRGAFDLEALRQSVRFVHGLVD
jgi:sugar phosphate isomerase/epimerase